MLIQSVLCEQVVGNAEKLYCKVSNQIGTSAFLGPKKSRDVGGVTRLRGCLDPWVTRN
jgi:hypothetical protein